MKMNQIGKQFINLLAARKGSARVMLYPYNQKEWFRGAYKTLQQTKKGGLGPTGPALVMPLIFNSLSKIRPATYDLDIKSLIQKVSNHGFTLGQSQKLCNMLIKYHLVYFFSKSDLVWNRKNPWVGKLAPRAHVPIDRFVLIRGAQLYPSYFKYLLKISMRFYKAWTLNIHIVWPRGSRSSHAWSKLNSYGPIDNLQQIFRTIAKTKGFLPIELEMRELWQP